MSELHIFQIPTFKDCDNLWKPYDLWVGKQTAVAKVSYAR